MSLEEFAGSICLVALPYMVWFMTSGVAEYIGLLTNRIQAFGWGLARFRCLAPFAAWLAAFDPLRADEYLGFR